jgi:ring-1,2-phenylacetyl-CoA epoxidase subunit PaaC
MSAASIALPVDRAKRDQSLYLLRIADSALIHAQRLAEWCGHAPVLEEDIALANLGLDLLGQARSLLTHVGGWSGHDEDQLAFLREERDYHNLTLVELPLRRGGADFADTQVRNLLVAAWLRVLWQRLQRSSDSEVAAIAGKAVKEMRYHVEHAADWVVRLGDGNDESTRRTHAALQRAWPYTAEMFDDDDVDEHAAASGLGPKASELRSPWLALVSPVLADARLEVPADTAFRSEGRRGRHSEHLGFVLAEMQHLQRSYPGGVW